MSESSKQAYSKLQQTQKQKDSVTGNPFVGYTDTINPRSEKLNTVTPMQTRELDAHHPFITNTAWIRALPQAGTRPVIVYRSDRFQPVILKYHQEDAESRVQSYFDKQGLYRPLKPGEIELSSSGFAQTYYAERGILENRTGPIKNWLNQDELEAGVKSPIHLLQLMNKEVGKLGNELRFGVVKRYDSVSKTIFPKIQGNYGQELFLNMKTIEGKLLTDIHYGQLTDDKGKELKHATTSQPLRFKENIYTDDGSNLSQEIDQKGNYEIKLPDSANEGYILKVPGGGIRIELNKNMNINGQSAFLATFKNSVRFEASGSAGLKLADGKVALGKPGTELLDLVSQAFQLLSQCYSVGTGSPLNTNPQFAQLKSKIDQIKGTL